MLWVMYPHKARGDGARTHENGLAFAKTWEGAWHRGKLVCNVSRNGECLFETGSHE